MPKTKRITAIITYTVGGKIEMDIPFDIKDETAEDYIRALMYEKGSPEDNPAFEVTNCEVQVDVESDCKGGLHVVS